MACWPWVLFLPLVAQAQSGSGDHEYNVSCFSHLNFEKQGTLTCQLEFEIIEDIINITLCSSSPPQPCYDGRLNENTITFSSLTALSAYELIIHFATMDPYRNTYILRNIIKPMPPWIVNATFSEKLNEASVSIGTPYQGDYLGGKLRFQVMLKGPEKPRHIDIAYPYLSIEGAYLRKDTEYYVRVRAIPNGDYFKGTWSEWSPYKRFRTPGLEESNSPVLIWILFATLFILLLTTAIVIQRWHKVIKSSIWPSIPNPKDTLLQMYKPNKGLPVSFNPEAFSDRNIHLVEHVEEKKSTPDLTEGWGNCEVRDRSQSHGCSGLVLRNPMESHRESSPMLPRSEWDGTDKPGGTLKVGLLDGSEVVHSNVDDGAKSLPVPLTGRREEAYVTMSSFLKTQ